MGNYPKSATPRTTAVLSAAGGLSSTIELCSHLMLRSRADHCMAAQHKMQAMDASDKATPCMRAAWNITIGPRENVMLREFAA
jgi:hypothetical protein